ncbi:hypothetical protein D7322_24700 [Sphingobacterium puteale]|uniref:Uncharacterized protein n=1 Tax=Sphingobacterium puteale TaxID=2420510 RepID=A0A420VRP2_9SPHI|nr:hypothetical protein [Sphingobacterium puteale]RKO68992.1 hypothetical protein D7322_24700 [Sphingobacterium puteale]
MRLSCRQLDFAQADPKGMAQVLKQNNFIKGGFNKVTHEVCFSLAKGIVDYNEAKRLLEIRLRDTFKDNKANRRRRELCQVVLHNFYTFLIQEGLTCILNYSEINLRLEDGHMIGGQSCAIFKDLDGNPVGVVLTDREFDFGSTLRLPIEQYWISRKMKATSLSAVRVFVYNTVDHSYQTISYSDERIQYVLKRSSEVITKVEIELQEIG